MFFCLSFRLNLIRGRWGSLPEASVQAEFGKVSEFLLSTFTVLYIREYLIFDEKKLKIIFVNYLI